MYLYWEQIVTENYFIIEYSLFVAAVGFNNFIESFRNFEVAQAVVAKISFQEELFNLEQSGKALPNRTGLFRPPPTVPCEYISKEIKIYDYESREPKTAYVGYGLLTHISEIKNNLGINTGIVPKIASFNMQKHDDKSKLWANALAIYVVSKMALNLKNLKSQT